MQRKPKKLVPGAYTAELGEVVLGIYNIKQASTMNQIAEIINKSNSYIANVLPLAISLDFVDYSGGIYKLTEKGERYAQHLIMNEKDNAASMLKQALQNIGSIQFLLTALKSRRKLDIAEIGRLLAEYCSKKWKNPKTFAVYGRKTADLLDVSGLASYWRSEGVVSLEKRPTRRVVGKIAPPSITVNKIIPLLKTLNIAGARRLSKLSQLLKRNPKRLVNELSSCVELGLVNRVKGGYTITEVGKQMINPISTREEIASIFRKQLLKNPYFKKIISSLSSQAAINACLIGELMAFEAEREWKKSTQELYGKKFLNWLVFANLVEKRERGEFALSLRKEELETISEPTIERKRIEIVPTGTLEDYTKILKKIGIIEHLLEHGKTEEIVDQIDFMGDALQRAGLSELSALIKKHFELFKRYRDSSILHPDLEIISNLIKKALSG